MKSQASKASKRGAQRTDNAAAVGGAFGAGSSFFFDSCASLFAIDLRFHEGMHAVCHNKRKKRKVLPNSAKKRRPHLSSFESRLSWLRGLPSSYGGFSARYAASASFLDRLRWSPSPMWASAWAAERE